MTDVARLGLVVDASGAQREIRLTREELVKLANGGTLAQKAVAGVAQPLTQTTVAARAATDGFSRLRGPLTQIAISASGIPGPLGRVASVLGQFSIGSALTVGVMAGIGAIGYAWEKATEKSRKAREEWQKQLDLLNDLRREQGLGVGGEAGAAVRAGRTRLGQIGAEMLALDNDPRQTRRMRDRRNELAAEYTHIALAVQAGELEVTRRVREEAEERDAAREREFQKELERVKRLNALRAENGLPALRLNGQVVAGANTIALQESIMAGVRTGPADLSASLNRTAVQMAATWEKLLDDDAKKKAAVQHAGQWGVNFAAERSGPFGGLVAGVGSALMAGNPFGAAAAGATGLVDALIGMDEASRQAREALHQLRVSMESFVDRMLLDIGSISQSEFNRNQAERDFQAARQAITDSIAANSWNGEDDEVRRLRATLADMDSNYAAWIAAIERNTEALTTATRNTPTGFFGVPHYLGANPLAVPGSSTPRRPDDPRGGGTTGMRPGGQTVFNVTISGVSDPGAVVRELRRQTNAVLGTGASVADGMEFWN